MEEVARLQCSSVHCSCKCVRPSKSDALNVVTVFVILGTYPALAELDSVDFSLLKQEVITID